MSYQDLRLSLPPGWRGAGKLLYVFREDYEPEAAFVSRILQPGMVVVDGGASHGIYSLIAANRVGVFGRVLAFEPAQRSFESLLTNIALNDFQNILAFPFALADHCGQARLYLHPDPSRNSLAAHGSSSGYQIVSAVRLDCLLRQLSIPRLDFIKLDVEGAEALALEGARDALEQWHPRVLFEINSPAAERMGWRSDRAWNLLKSFGYRFYRLNHRGELEHMELPVEGNIIALKES